MDKTSPSIVFDACCDFKKEWLRTYLQNLCMFLKVPPHTASVVTRCIIVYFVCCSVLHTTQTCMVQVLCMRIIIILPSVVRCSIFEWFLLFYFTCMYVKYLIRVYYVLENHNWYFFVVQANMLVSHNRKTQQGAYKSLRYIPT